MGPRGVILGLGVGVLVVLLAAALFGWWVRLSQPKQVEREYQWMIIGVTFITVGGVVLKAQRSDLDWWQHTLNGFGVLVGGSVGVLLGLIRADLGYDGYGPNFSCPAGACGALSGTALTFMLIGRGDNVSWAITLGFVVVVGLASVLAAILHSRPE